MCWKKFCIAAATAVCLVLAWPTSSDAAFVSWTNASGTAGNLTWSGGGSESGIWGNPDTHFPPFAFNPGNGLAFSVNNNSGNSTTLDSPMQVYLDVPIGFEISGINLNEDGLYSITGGGFVKDSAEIRVQNLATFATSTNSGVLFSANADASLAWSGSLGLSLPAGYQHVMLIIDNNLQAGSTTGGAAFIDKKGIEVNVSIEAIGPEPTSLGWIVCAYPLLVRTKRKRSTIQA